MNDNQQTPVSNPTPQVGFPVQQPKPAGKSNKWLIIFLLLLILGAAGIFFFATRAGKTPEATPTPESETSLPTPEPTASPAPVDRSKIKIEIQNGTGISGESAYLQGVLANLGYKNIKVGNASSQNNTTTVVTFAKTLDAQIVEEVTAKLEEIYKSVDAKTSSTQTNDVLIVTGLRKGATAKPSATPTPTPSASPSGSPTTAPTTNP